MSALKHSASCKLRNDACESTLSSAKQEFKSIVHASVAAPILMILFHAAGSCNL